MLSLLLVITLPLYYVLKGIIVKETKALTVLTLVLFSGNLCVAYFMQEGWFRIIIMVYLVYTFAEYMCLMYLKRVIYELPLMTTVSIISEEAIINYNFFRPAILIPVNIFLFFKRYPRIGINDCIGVDIKSKDGTKIKIKL